MVTGRRRKQFPRVVTEVTPGLAVEDDRTRVDLSAEPMHTLLWSFLLAWPQVAARNLQDVFAPHTMDYNSGGREDAVWISGSQFPRTFTRAVT